MSLIHCGFMSRILLRVKACVKCVGCLQNMCCDGILTCDTYARLQQMVSTDYGICSVGVNFCSYLIIRVQVYKHFSFLTAKAVPSNLIV